MQIKRKIYQGGKEMSDLDVMACSGCAMTDILKAKNKRLLGVIAVMQRKLEIEGAKYGFTYPATLSDWVDFIEEAKK